MRRLLSCNRFVWVTKSFSFLLAKGNYMYFFTLVNSYRNISTLKNRMYLFLTSIRIVFFVLKLREYDSINFYYTTSSIFKPISNCTFYSCRGSNTPTACGGVLSFFSTKDMKLVNENVYLRNILNYTFLNILMLYYKKFPGVP